MKEQSVIVNTVNLRVKTPFKLLIRSISQVKKRELKNVGLTEHEKKSGNKEMVAQLS